MFAIMLKPDAFVAKIVNTRQTKISMAIFARADRPPTSATLHCIECIYQSFFPVLPKGGFQKLLCGICPLRGYPPPLPH